MNGWIWDSSWRDAKDKDLALWMGPGSHWARKRLRSSVNVLVPWTSLQIQTGCVTGFL